MIAANGQGFSAITKHRLLGDVDNRLVSINFTVGIGSGCICRSGRGANGQHAEVSFASSSTKGNSLDFNGVLKGLRSFFIPFGLSGRCSGLIAENGKRTVSDDDGGCGVSLFIPSRI